MIVLDTSGVLAAIDDTQRRHAECAEVLQRATEPLLLSPIVLAELDYLLGTWVGQHAEMRFLSDVAGGAYRLEAFSQADVGLAVDVIDRYRDLELGLADASVVVLARRYATDDLLTLDQRHFRPIEAGPGRSFRLLPLDL